MKVRKKERKKEHLVVLVIGNSRDFYKLTTKKTLNILEL